MKVDLGFNIGEEFFAMYNNEVHAYTLAKVECEVEPTPRVGTYPDYEKPIVRVFFWSDEHSSNEVYYPCKRFDARRCFHTKKELLDSL